MTKNIFNTPPLALDRRDIARDRFSQHRLGVLGDDAVEIVAVEHVERKRRHRPADMADLARRQRNKIRIAAHEREPLAVGGDGEGVAGTDNPFPLAAPVRTAILFLLPMQHRAAFEMTAAADQRDAVPQLEGVAFP
jgi:hypothetical protein